MLIYTDNTDFAARYYPNINNWRQAELSAIDPNLVPLAKKLFESDHLFIAEISTGLVWKHLFIVEFSDDSQYDILNNYSDKYAIELPDGLLCLAGSGKRFHGWRNRPWASLPGNIHLSIYLKPMCEMEHFGGAFMSLSAVSVMQTIDKLKGMSGSSMVKWVNDIFIANHKVCGFLAKTQLLGSVIISTILGIGLNVLAKPDVIADAYIQNATSLLEFVNDLSECNEEIVFNSLIENIDRNYKLLLDGHYANLLDIYRERSIVLGKHARIFSDSHTSSGELLCEGKVTAIGMDLELYLEGVDAPIISGRLAL